MSKPSSHTTAAISTANMHRTTRRQMDVLTLKSVADSLSTLLYCNLTVANLNNEIMSSRKVNFSDGSNIFVDFYDSGDEGEIEDNWVIISISDCAVLNSQGVHDSLSFDSSLYVADPCSFAYMITFRDTDQLSNDPINQTEALSKQIFLSVERGHDNLQSRKALLNSDDVNKNHRANPSIADAHLELPSKLLSLPSISTFRLPRSITFDDISRFTEILGAGNDTDINSQTVILNFWLIFIFSRIISYMKKLVKNSPSNGRSTVEFSGSHDIKPENQDVLDQLQNDHCLTNLRSLEIINRGPKVWDAILAEEYYNMIENATGNVALDYMSYGNDTESESEFLTIVDARGSRSPSTSGNAAQLEAAADSTNFLPPSTIEQPFLLSEVGGLERALTSVDMVEMAFLTGT